MKVEFHTRSFSIRMLRPFINARSLSHIGGGRSVCSNGICTCRRRRFVYGNERKILKVGRVERRSFDCRCRSRESFPADQGYSPKAYSLRCSIWKIYFFFRSFRSNSLNLFLSVFLPHSSPLSLKSCKLMFSYYLTGQGEQKISRPS